MDDCPGCKARIEEGSPTCPHCNYDILSGTPAKVKAAPKPKKSKELIPVAVAVAPEPEQTYDEYVDEDRPQNQPKLGGMRLSHSVALGNYGTPDISYSALFWPKDQEITDDNLREWAVNFREEYRTQVSCRSSVYLSNHAIANWCAQEAVWHAKRHGKDGRNDVLLANADRILRLLGGEDYTFRNW
jgi:hypothetical protein